MNANTIWTPRRTDLIGLLEISLQTIHSFFMVEEQTAQSLTLLQSG